MGVLWFPFREAGLRGAARQCWPSRNWRRPCLILGAGYEGAAVPLPIASNLFKVDYKAKRVLSGKVLAVVPIFFVLFFANKMPFPAHFFRYPLINNK